MMGACTSSSPAATGDAGAGDASVDAPATPFTEAAMRAASIAYNTKLCAAAQQCDPYLFDYSFGTLAACVDADAPVADLAIWFSFGTTLTPDSLTTCAETLDLSTCEAYERFIYESVVPDACLGVSFGSLPDGSSCSVSGIETVPLWNQCASGRCLSEYTATCGTCVAAQALESACEGTAYCAAGLACAHKVCVPFADVGQSCDPVMSPCHYDLVCSGGTCAVPPPDNSCDPAIGCAPFPTARNCNPTTGQCESVVVSLGEPCGVTSSSYLTCAFGSACSLVREADGDGGVSDAETDGGAAAQYVCAPVIPDGEPCILADYPFQDPCLRGALHTSGCNHSVCERLGPAECAAPLPPP
jgi:hypothetical protein